MATAHKTIGSLLPGIIPAPFGSTASPPLSTQPWSNLDLNTLPTRLDDLTMRRLREIALSPLPDLERCSEAHFNRCMKALDILPRRASDAASGALAVKLYRAKLGTFSDAALSWLIETGLEQFQWFPTIAECLELLRAWPSREVAMSRQDKASMLVQRELNTRLDETIARLERRDLSDEQVNALPRQVQAIGWTKGLLWKFIDGTFAVRPDLRDATPDEIDAVRAWVAANADRIIHG